MEEASTGANSSVTAEATPLRRQPSQLFDSSEMLMLSFDAESSESNIFD